MFGCFWGFLFYTYTSDFKKGCEMFGNYNPVNKVNQICNMRRKFLKAHSEYDRSQMQGYLALSSSIMNPSLNKYENLLALVMRNS